MIVLGIESSCDETSVSIVKKVTGFGQVLSEKTLSQADKHQVFGGVVPELASREHSDSINKLMKEVLKEAKYDFNNVVKTTIFLYDMNDFQVVNKLYSSYFEKGNEPARETVEVSALPKGAKIEISVIAKK